MTKETKVGLLVGLAFIILFAIILSEKGATNNVSSPSNLGIADARHSSGPGNSRHATPLSNVGKIPIESTIPPASSTRTSERPSASISSRTRWATAPSCPGKPGAAD